MPAAEPITLTCPANIHIDNVAGTSRSVTFAAPMATGGVPPLTITCNPASGSLFPIGDTQVACSATDGIRSGACNFRVTLVAQILVLSVTRFLAFGDSITAGENGQDARPFFIDTPNAYPVLLTSLLRGRYTSQTLPNVVNVGVPAETAYQGQFRIDRELNAHPTDGLLLLEGVNDLHGDLPRDGDIVIDALRYDVQAGKARGIAVFLSTLTPLDPAGFRGAQNWTLIPPVNERIRALAVEQNVALVDSFAAFGSHGKVGDYLDSDGLHPTPAGNQAVANAFFDAIRKQLEVAPSVASNARRAW